MRSSRSPSRTAPISIGTIARPHGIRGEVRLRPWDDRSDLFARKRRPKQVRIRLGDADPVPYEIQEARVHSDGSVLLALAGVETRNDAERLRGGEVLADRKDLPKPNPNEWFAEDLIGLAVASPEGTTLGSVRDVYANGAHEILIVETPTGDVDVPFVEAHVGDVDLEAGRVVALDLDALRPR